MHCFSSKAAFKFPDDAWDFPCEHENDLQNTMNTTRGDVEQRAREVANIQQVHETQGVPVDDYE